MERGLDPTLWCRLGPRTFQDRIQPLPGLGACLAGASPGGGEATAWSILCGSPGSPCARVPPSQQLHPGHPTSVHAVTGRHGPALGLGGRFPEPLRSSSPSSSCKVALLRIVWSVPAGCAFSAAARHMSLFQTERPADGWRTVLSLRGQVWFSAGSFWRIDPASENKLVEQAFRKRWPRACLALEPLWDPSRLGKIEKFWLVIS